MLVFNFSGLWIISSCLVREEKKYKDVINGTIPNHILKKCDLIGFTYCEFMWKSCSFLIQSNHPIIYSKYASIRYSLAVLIVSVQAIRVLENNVLTNVLK